MPHARPIRIMLWYCFIAHILISCATLPVSGNIPPGIVLEHITRIPANSPFAPDPAGTQVALTNNGLTLLNVTTRKSASLSPDTPQALAWTPDGRRLAAAFLNEHGSKVCIYDTGGNMLGSHVVAGRVSTLVWRGESELLIAAMETNVFSFGVNFVQVFYRWDNGKPPVRFELQNSTLRTKLISNPGRNLYRFFTFTLSPYGDAIIYSRLHDPPAIFPSLRYILRNLATGSEREIASATLNAGGAIFAGGDDRILYGDGVTETVLRDPWFERSLAAFPFSGRSLAASGGGKTLLIDGNLFREGQQLFSFPADATGAFNTDGNLLFVRQGDRLLLVSGLSPDPAPTVPARNHDRFLTLRQWRSDGLINPTDLTNALKQMEKP